MIFFINIIPTILSDIQIKNFNKNIIDNNNKSSSSKTKNFQNINDIDWWPKFHHDNYNKGYSSSNASETNNIRWSYYIGDSLTSPAVANNKVYVGSNNKKIYCLNSSNGNLIWSYTTDDNIYLSSPVIDNYKLYINEVSKIICLNAETGSLIWTYNSGGGWSSPIISNDKIYVGSNNNKIYCLDANNGNIIWTYTTGDSVESSPAIYNDKVFVGSNDNKFYCLDANTGNMIWNYTTSNMIESSPAVDNGKVYFASANSYMYCFNADTGIKIWDHPFACVRLSSPAIAYGKIYIGSYCNGNIYCLDLNNGNKIWNYTTNDNIWSSPAIANGKIYIGSDDYTIYCLFALTGNFIWSFTTGNSITSSPAIADNFIYVTSGDGKIYCFGVSFSPPIPFFTWTPQYPNPGETITFNASQSYDPDGTITLYQWDWNNDGNYEENHTTPIATHTYTEPGAYKVTLKVTDNDGLYSTLTKNIFVGNIPPFAYFTWTPQNPLPNETITFNASQSYDPDGTITLYQWDWNNDGNYEENHTTPIATHTYTEPGSYQVTLKVTDNEGAYNTSTKNIFIAVSPPIAIFTWTPQNPLSGETITFNASQSYAPDGIITLYQWDWNNDGIYDENHTTPIATHTYTEPGSYQVTLKVTDNEGLIDIVSHIVNVGNRPPVAQFEWIPEKPLPGVIIKFDASQSYDPDGTITLYQWDWNNDGYFEDSSVDPISNHLWEEPGNYTINLRVIDNFNASDIEIKNINVTGDLITEANWGDTNYTGDKPGQFLTYKLQKSNGYQQDINKGWSRIDISVLFSMARNNVYKNLYKSGILTKSENILFNFISNKILSSYYNNKTSRNGRNGQSWASIGFTFTATKTAQAHMSINGKLNGNFWTDIKSQSDITNWVDARLHVIEKDLYKPDQNEGESCLLYHYDFNINSKNIDVILDNTLNVNLTEGKEYIVYLKLKIFSSLSPKIPIINGYRSKLDFGSDTSDNNGINFSYIGIQYLDC